MLYAYCLAFFNPLYVVYMVCVCIRITIVLKVKMAFNLVELCCC